MDFNHLITRSFDIVKRRRYLWWLGLLAALTGGGYGRISQWNLGNYTDPGRLDQGSPALNGGSDVLGTATSWLGANAAVWVAGVVLFLIFLAILYISYASKAALIKSADRIESGGDEWQFIDAYRAGRKYVFRLFGFSLFCALAILLFLAIFSTPIALLFLWHQTAGTVLAIALIVIGLLLLIALALFLVMILPIVERNIVLGDKRIWLSITTASRTLATKFVNLLLVYLVNVGLSVGYSIVLGIALLIVGSVLFGIGYLIHMINATAGIVYAVLAAIAVLASLLGVAGFFTAYLSTYWTLAYRQLNNGAKE